ncbi:DUF2848 family protein [Streptomyces youssoufiensis]
MNPPSPTLRLRVAGADLTLDLSPRRLVVAGYTARDEAAVAAHIAELAAIGVPPPPSVPAFYELDPVLLTTDPVIKVAGETTSGEVEPVLIRHRGLYYLAVGSDHTDRALERADIAASKAACPKPISAQAIALGTDPCAADWERLTVACQVDDAPYQRGPAALLRHPAELLGRMSAGGAPADADLVLFCGTLPLLAGEFVPGTHWRLRLELAGGPTLSHAYETKRRSA